MAKFVSEAFEELKKQVESLGLDEKSKSKFLMEEWRKMREAEAEEKKAEREAAVEERRAEREAEERRLLAEREASEKRAKAEERKAAMELERLKLELEAKRLETAARPAGIAEEMIRRSARIAQSPELPALLMAEMI